MYKEIFIFAFLVISCNQNNQQNKQVVVEEKKTCIVPDGKYPVQDATFNKTKGTYELLLLGTPSCWKQPATVSDIELGRIDESENEKAVLKFVGGKATNLLIAKDYTLKTVETIVENGKEKVTESSSWAPFLSGAAGGLVGGVVGNVIADKMRSKNEPPPQMPTTNSRDLNQGANAPKPVQKNFFQSKDSKQQPHNTKIYKNGSRQAKSGSSGGFFKKKRR